MTLRQLDDRPLGPPYCEEPNPTDQRPSIEGHEPIRCGFRKGHDGPHGWDLDALRVPPMTAHVRGK